MRLTTDIHSGHNAATSGASINAGPTKAAAHHHRAGQPTALLTLSRMIALRLPIGITDPRAGARHARFARPLCGPRRGAHRGPNATGPTPDMLKPRNPLAVAEADLAALEKRRAALDARRAVVASASLAAVADRRRLLCDSDEPPAADLAKADRACRDAADSEAAAVDALAELDNRILGVKDRIARLREAAERERQAAALDAIATKVDEAAKRITKAAREIAAARADLAAAILPEVAGLYAPPYRDSYGTPTALVTRSFAPQGRALDSTLSPDTVASRFAGHIIAPVLPTLGLADEAEAHAWHQPRAVTHTLVGTDTAEAVAALFAVPLRSRAEALRNGEVLPDPDPYVPAPEDPLTAGMLNVALAERVPPGFTGEVMAPGRVKLTPISGEVAA